MLKSLVLASVAAGATLAGTATLARDHGAAEMRDRFVEMDLNGDGVVTRDELETAQDARFAEADADGSGTLTEAEFVAAAVERARARAAQAFARLDADGDGMLSRDAVEAQHRHGRGLDRIFERVDANGDDQVTTEEFEAALAWFSDMRERRGHWMKRQ